MAVLALSALSFASLAVVGPGTAGAQTVVSTEAEFRAAFTSDSDIVLANDIVLGALTCDQAVRGGPNSPVLVDGAGHSIARDPSCAFDFDGRVLAVFDSSDLTLRNVTITGGKTTDDGGGVYVEDGDLIVEDSTITGNIACEFGAGIDDDESGGVVSIVRSTIADNHAGVSDGPGGAGGVGIEEGGSLTVVNSTITQNTAQFDSSSGGGIGAFDADVTLVYSDLVGNRIERTAPEGCDVNGGTDADEEAAAAVGTDDPPPVEGQQLDPADNLFVEMFDSLQFGVESFGSVVALPTDFDNCGFGGPTMSSSGYNFSDDDTCGFTNAAAGDRENAGDPGLGALADNGGPTQTLLPARTSPLVNFIPLAACGGGDALAGSAVTTDQRGVARPQETGCEIGSVELELVVLFTG